MPLQGFIDGEPPVVGATWLNALDAFYFTLFNSATTPAQALTALGVTAYIQTLLDDTDAATAAATLQVIANTLLTTTGDSIIASGANTPARLAAAATVAAHATTTNPWSARIVTLSGGAVTFTDIADAPYIGASVLLIMNAAHIWTDGAVFDVQGGATYTTAAGDQVLLVATAVDAFDVTIFPASGAQSGTVSSTLTFNGSGGSTGSLTLSWQKQGKIISVNIPTAQGTTGTGSSQLVSNTALPTTVRPTAAQACPINSITNNGAALSSAGVAIVGTDGIITIIRDNAGTAFTNSAVAGTSQPVTISYFIG